MTLILRLSNLISILLKSEAAPALAAGRSIKPRSPARPSAAGEEFGARVAADAWQYACNQRAFR